MWAEAGAQPEVEEALGIGGFGYPVSCIIVYMMCPYGQLLSIDYNVTSNNLQP